MNHRDEHAAEQEAKAGGFLRRIAVPKLFRPEPEGVPDGQCERGHWLADCTCWDDVEEGREHGVLPGGIP